jgi:hypothetical protein
MDKNNPNDIMKIMARAKKLEYMLRQYRIMVELTEPGAGDMIIKAILMGGVIGQNDKDWDEFSTDLEKLVNDTKALIENVAKEMLLKKLGEEKTETPDPAKMHEDDKTNKKAH